MTRISDQTAALGFRVHSGWAVLAILSGPVSAPGIVSRQRIEIADAKIPGSSQPYHAAEALSLKEAERLVKECTDSAMRLAEVAIHAVVADAKRKGYHVSAAGVLTGSGKPIPALEKILASHPLLHAAEGELFRSVILAASENSGLIIVTAKEKELLAGCPARLGMSDAVIQQHLARMGKAIGSPWRQDEKFAALAAWMAMADEAPQTEYLEVHARPNR